MTSSQRTCRVSTEKLELLSAMFRKTKQRDAILRVLRNTKTHPTVQWIYDQVRSEIPNISMGTVYRNLKYLKQKFPHVEAYQISLYREDDFTDKYGIHVCPAVKYLNIIL